ncbi:hypothetical protein Cgig2_023544 [Carnegiea gigantea]|uniref:MULE transposase domain-containing protein n=1 Tax=Carnegiea gigantea TaxID=171969 RepID=A0A9Q1JTW2_9CARY|nr:hypothetical protein Cgig2_023544 [Carnegiea gigantea]
MRWLEVAVEGVTIGKDIRHLVVYYKDKVIRIIDVEMEKYSCIELFRDARASAKELGIEFPKLTKFWEDVRSKCIPIYMYDMKKPSNNQKHVESLDQISASAAQSLPQIVAVESKKNVRMVSGVEDLTDSQANIWADSLIVSPAVALVKPVAHRPIIRSVANSPVKPTPSSQPRPCEPPQSKSTSLKKSCKYPAKATSTFSPKPTAKASPLVQLKVKGKSSYYLPVSPSPSPHAKADCTSLQSILESTPKVDELLDFDVGSLCRESKWEVEENEWDDVDGEKTGDVDDSEDVSLDEENNNSESGDDEQLKVQVKQKMQLGAEIIDSDANRDVIVNKMARTLRQGTLWTRNRDDKETVIRKYGIHIPDYTCWRVRKMMKDAIDGKHEEGCKYLAHYTEEFKAKNPGSFSLAYTVVEKENKEEWTFFLSGLVRALDAVDNQSMYTITCDRHKGIIKALRTVMPNASRRTCVIHYYKNFASLYPGAWFHALFYIAANAYASFVHEKAMEKIREKGPGAYHWLRDNEKLELGARFKFNTNLKCDDNTNNFVKSFNYAIVKFRGLRILTMLEKIRKLIGSSFVKRFE